MKTSWAHSPAPTSPEAEKGTSCAAPIVTGVAALLLRLQLERGTAPDADAVRAAVLNSAIPCDLGEVEEPARSLRDRLDIAGATALLMAGTGVTESAHAPCGTDGRWRVARRQAVDTQVVHPEELDAYNALVPDGSNWKATMTIEYVDVDERRDALSRLRGIEDRVWVQVAGHEKVWAIVDEDLERANDLKTSAVHFLRFELPAEMVADVKKGADVAAGIDHVDSAGDVWSAPTATPPTGRWPRWNAPAV